MMEAYDPVLIIANKSPINLALNVLIQYCHNHCLMTNKAKTQQIIIDNKKIQVAHLPNFIPTTEAKYLELIHLTLTNLYRVELWLFCDQ